MKKRMRLSIVPIILFFLVFAIFAYFRFSNFGNRITFGWDQEQFSFQVRQILVDHKPVLLGPRTTNDRGFFLGPYFTYLMIPFFLITRLHPMALAVFLITYNIVFFVSTYFIIKKLFGKASAFLFLAFWSINPLLAHYDITPWWPIYIPLATCIVWFLLKKIYDNNRILTWFLLGSVIGLVIHMHVQSVFIFVFACIALFYMRGTSRPSASRLGLFFLPIFLSFTPLVLFDLRHDFLNTRTLLGFFSHSEFPPSITAWIPVLENVIQPITIAKSLFITILFYCSLLAIQCFMYLNKKGFIKLFYVASIILWVIFPIAFATYGQRPSEYYFLFLYPFIYTIIADFFYSIKKVPVLFIFLILLFIINLKELQLNLKTDYYSLKYKDELIRLLAKEVKGKVFNLSYTTELTTDYGFRYLILYYQLKPTGNWKDPLVQIKIPADTNCSIKVANMGIIIPKELSN